VATKLEVFGLVDHAHATTANLAQYAVMRNRLPNGLKRRRHWRECYVGVWRGSMNAAAELLNDAVMRYGLADHAQACYGGSVGKSMKAVELAVFQRGQISKVPAFCNRDRWLRRTTLLSFGPGSSDRPPRAFSNIRASSDSRSTERRKTDCSIQTGNPSILTIRSQRTGRQQAFRKAGFDPTRLRTQLCNSQIDF